MDPHAGKGEGESHSGIWMYFFFLRANLGAFRVELMEEQISGAVASATQRDAESQ